MAISDSKPHYALLDGLRGVAALLVVWYHVFEGFQFASGKATVDVINHGYLAVDFFFVLFLAIFLSLFILSIIPSCMFSTDGSFKRSNTHWQRRGI